MSTPMFGGEPVTRRKPELVSVRVVPWEEQLGLFGLVYEFDDGETFGEMWGSWEETERVARIRKQDIRPLSKRSIAR